MKKKRIIIALVILTALIIGIIYLTCINKPKTKKPRVVELTFGARLDKLNSFDSGDYYKFGWLQVQGTNIDLPILDSSSISAELNYSYGWDSPMYVHEKDFDMLLGHNVLNVSSQPMLPNDTLTNFEELMAFTYYDFAKDNLYAQYTRKNEENVYLIYAVGFSDYIDNEFINLNNKKARDEYIKDAIDASIYDYNIDVNSDDKLLALQTCTRMFGNEYNQQLTINLRKLRKNEKTIKYSVKKNKNYKQVVSLQEKM